MILTGNGWSATILGQIQRTAMTSNDQQRTITNSNETKPRHTEMTVLRSLEDYRNLQCLGVEEFATQLGVSTGTYYRMLERKDVHPSTKRRVAAVLHTPPFLIAEFFPQPSQTLRDAVDAIIERADQQGWRVVDPETLEPTGERLTRSGVQDR
ncbi:hypothetical protein K2Z83_22800 [Oscillochloris sp. ZM17-4]|uniref:hypothetical protein n=1 Tax=Oscillochloris sp. ZM17-4 TaxID=2866714 RepID=UPI001C7349BC|nr:hypothetical protein [Oscillochloris sp. ZM17-4]MBX0330488.1 hypothetical protein [Oscillochloris sp. ZM17-4]